MEKTKISSIVNEVITTISSQFIFFFEKILNAQKGKSNQNQPTKTKISEQKTTKATSEQKTTKATSFHSRKNF